ncbi:hypothetical protein COU03_04060, partial [bacterium (Candidatus Gribaldobacteria) CG10_big_fil_rev_8_21_14_0_10_41_12]
HLNLFLVFSENYMGVFLRSHMYNWSVDTKELKKDKKRYKVWQLEQLINFGLAKEKINLAELKKYWGLLNLDPNKKRYLSFLLWPKKQF